MHPLGDTRYHLRLISQMGKVTEAHLTEAFETGRITSRQWADMIDRCRACTAPAECERWLSAHPRAHETPQYCVNADILSDLKEGGSPSKGCAESGPEKS